MKTRLIYTALMAAAAIVMPSCDESGSPFGTQTSTESANQENPQSNTPVADEPTREDIINAITPHLTAYPWLAPDEITLEPTTGEDGTARLNAHIKLSVRENVYRQENPPAAFNNERKAINQSTNAAMQPDSVYLLQIGAPTDAITEENRSARSLPENLQQMVNEMRQLAEETVYVPVAEVGTQYEVLASMKADKTETGWQLSDVTLQTANLPEADNTCAESALPEGAQRLSDEFVANRINELKAKIEAFNSAAAPYINGREEEARAKWTEYRARVEEEARRTAEAATAAAAEREQWINHCVTTLASGAVFRGEWVRDSKFGKISLEISLAEKFESSVQFYGIIYDTNLPEAKLDITGRCEFTKNEDGTSRLHVTIHEGFYDPDQPTAEVYDSEDGVLQLTVDDRGNLRGIMTCGAWRETPDKAINVSFSPAQQQPQSAE